MQGYQLKHQVAHLLVFKNLIGFFLLSTDFYDKLIAHQRNDKLKF
jgi:hypothetical protein